MIEVYDVCFIVMDLETTGFTADQNQIAQIAFVVLNEKLETLDQAVSFIQKYDNKVLLPSTMKFTGITEDEMAKGMSADELYTELVKLFKESKRGRYRKPVLVGHNFPEFDMPFLEYIFRRKNDNIYNYVERFVEDTMFLARKRWGVIPMENYKLETCCSKAGIKLLDGHEALADTQATAELFKYFILTERGSSEGMIMNTAKSGRSNFEF